MSLIVSWGGGVNSTAMLVGLRERGEFPNSILFADPGSENPDTYAYLNTTNRWLASVGFPNIVTVQNDGQYRTLENECLSKHTLPSIAFGFKSCSDKYKRRPQTKWLKERYGDLSALTLCIGFDADEPHRAENGAAASDAYARRFPLIEWGWGREECIRAIRRAGLPVPPKSACFFCPSSSKHEVRRLAREYPDLMARALLMETNAAMTCTQIKGLGRNWSWREVVQAAESQLALFPDSVETPCGCWDGEP
jgi:hypothetical protein